MTNIAIENGHRNSGFTDYPLKIVIFQSHVYLPQCIQCVGGSDKRSELGVSIFPTSSLLNGEFPQHLIVGDGRSHPATTLKPDLELHLAEVGYSPPAR